LATETTDPVLSTARDTAARVRTVGRVVTDWALGTHVETAELDALVIVLDRIERDLDRAVNR